MISPKFACKVFWEAATVFSHSPCGERDIADTRRRTVPPPLEPRPASLVVTRWWPVLKPEKTAALIHPSARKGFFRKFERRGFSELLLSPRTSMLSAGLSYQVSTCSQSP